MPGDAHAPRMTDGGPPHPAPAFAEFIDPIALEERLQNARARRAVALANRRAAAAPGAAATTAPAPAAPVAPRGAAAYSLLGFLAGVGAAAAAGGFLAARPTPAPEVVLTAAIPAEPGALPSAPRPAADRRPEAPPSPVLAPPAAPTAPFPSAAPWLVAPSKARAGGAPAFADAAPVLKLATSSAHLPMMSRSSAGLPYPLVRDDRDRSPPRAAPKPVRQTKGPLRQAENLLRQLGKAGQSAVRGLTRSDPGKSLARTLRRPPQGNGRRP
jgi:hypothetical protein